jgi:hypothetical protein
MVWRSSASWDKIAEKYVVVGTPLGHNVNLLRERKSQFRCVEVKYAEQVIRFPILGLKISNF